MFFHQPVEQRQTYDKSSPVVAEGICQTQRAAILLLQLHCLVKNFSCESITKRNEFACARFGRMKEECSGPRCVILKTAMPLRYLKQDKDFVSNCHSTIP